MMRRREFLKGVGVTGLAMWSGTFSGTGLASALAVPAFGEDPWSQLPAILARIKAPVFPNRDFDVTKYGAIGDNKTDCTLAFEKAIAACYAAKGGRVVVPAGEFVTGAIRLKSNVNLYITPELPCALPAIPQSIRWYSLAGKALS